MTNGCRECGEAFEYHGGTGSTYVGYVSPPGHDHNDNCQKRGYVCANRHVTMVAKQNSCPACDWVGKEGCFCHKGKKVKEWPPDVPDSRQQDNRIHFLNHLEVIK